jgi:hypothetical protein
MMERGIETAEGFLGYEGEIRARKGYSSKEPTIPIYEGYPMKIRIETRISDTSTTELILLLPQNQKYKILAVPVEE